MKRIRQHNGALSGGASYTKRFRPWAFYAIFRFNSRHDALSVEWKTKQRKKSDGPPGPSSIVRRIYRHGAARVVLLSLSVVKYDALCLLERDQVFIGKPMGAAAERAGPSL